MLGRQRILAPRASRWSSAGRRGACLRTARDHWRVPVERKEDFAAEFRFELGVSTSRVTPQRIAAAASSAAGVPRSFNVEIRY